MATVGFVTENLNKITKKISALKPYFLNIFFIIVSIDLANYHIFDGELYYNSSRFKITFEEQLYNDGNIYKIFSFNLPTFIFTTCYFIIMLVIGMKTKNKKLRFVCLYLSFFIWFILAMLYYCIIAPDYLEFKNFEYW